MKKYLIVCLARIGDILQSLPLIQLIKTNDPDSRIALMVNVKYRELTALIPGVSECYDMDFDYLHKSMHAEPASIETLYGYFNTTFSDIRKKKYDHIINVTPHYIGVYAAFLAGAEKLLTSDRGDWNNFYLFITLNWQLLPFHLSDLFIKIAGLESRPNRPCIQINNQAENLAESFLKQAGHDRDRMLIGLNTGASEIEKKWPEEYFLELTKLLIEYFDCTIILFGTRADNVNSKKFIELFPRNIINAVEKTSLVLLAALIDRTELFITNDTGPMHLAAACSTRIISLHMGKETCSTTGPYGTGHYAVQPDMACHPCRQPSSCRHRKCSFAVKPAVIFTIAKTIFGQQRAGLIDEIAPVKSNIYSSQFNAAGFLEYIPSSNSEVAISELMTCMLRAVWDLTLDNPPRSRKSVWQREIQRLRISCEVNNISSIYREWAAIEIVLVGINTLAEEAISLLNELELLGHKPHIHIERLKQISKRLETIDGKIYAFGMQTEYCECITKFFMYEKDKIESADICVLARKTSKAYTLLYKRVDFLNIMANSFFTSNQSTAQGGKHEYNRQWHDSR